MKKRLAWFVVLIMILAAFAVPVAAATEICNVHTQGYWKNHEAAWTNDDCPTIGEINTQEEWLDVLKTPPKGDPWFLLAHQYIASFLSGLDGPSMDDAARILGTYGPGQIPEGDEEDQTRYLANLFDAYNNNEL